MGRLNLTFSANFHLNHLKFRLIVCKFTDGEQKVLVFQINNKKDEQVKLFIY